MTALDSFLTVLRPVNKRHKGAKTLSRKSDGSIESFPAGGEKSRRNAVQTIPVNSFQELMDAVDRLTKDASAFVIRGRLKEGFEGKTLRRKSQNTLEEEAPFEEVPQRWVMLDIDNCALPEWSTDPQNEAQALAEYVTQFLPEAFQGVKASYQYSASMGLKDGIRIHLWYWLDRPVEHWELKRWLQGSDVTVDTALFNPVQPHFVASPLLADGMENPYPNRAGVVHPDAPDTVHVPEIEFQRKVSGYKPEVRQNGEVTTLHQAIHRDPISGLITDGRERFMFDLCREQGSRLLSEGVPLTEENLSERVHRIFWTECDHTDQKYSHHDVERKVINTVEKHNSGQYPIYKKADVGQLEPALSPYFDFVPVSLQEGEAQVSAFLDDFFTEHLDGKNLQRCLRVTMGVGKTHQTITRLIQLCAESTDQVIEVYVPRHDIASEWYETLTQGQANATIQVIQSREGRDPDSPLCQRPQYVKALTENKVSVYRNACERFDGQRCVHYESCAYIQQFPDILELDFGSNHILIYQHAHLSLPRNPLEQMLDPTMVVIDENCVDALITTHIEIQPELIRDYWVLPDHPRLGDTIVEALKNDTPLWIELANEGITAEEIEGIDLEDLEPDIRFEPRATRLTHIQGATDYRALSQLRDLMVEEMSAGVSDRPLRILYDQHKRVVRLAFKVPHRVPDNSHVLVLDATAQLPVLQAVFPDITMTQVDVRQNAVVYQIYDRTGSNEYWKGRSAPIQELAEILNTWGSLGYSVLCVSSMPVEKRLKSETQLDKNVQLNHFQNLRGTNAYEACDIVIIVGRNEPPNSAIDLRGRALFWRDDPQLNPDVAVNSKKSNVRLPMELRGYTQPYNTDGFEGVYVNAFTDQRFNALHQMSREAETVQAMARLRMVRSRRKKTVVLLSNVPVETEIHHVLKQDDLLPDKYVMAFLEAGHLPMSPLGLYTCRRDLVANYDIAKNAFKRIPFLRSKGRQMFLPDLVRALLVEAHFTLEVDDKRNRVEQQHLFLLKDSVELDESNEWMVGELPFTKWEAQLREAWRGAELTDLTFRFLKQGQMAIND